MSNQARGTGTEAGSSTGPSISETVHVNGIDLYTRSIGEGADVVILHGGPGAHHDYLLPQFDALARGRRLRYYDQRGGGRSQVDRNTPLGWDEHVADLHALIGHWEIEPAVIVGYSWGGLLALLYAIEHTESAARIALISPAPITAKARKEFERRFTERIQAPQIAEARAALQASELRERDPQAHRQRAFELSVAAYFREPGRARNLTPFRVTGRTQEAVWQSLGDYDLTDQVAELSLPALVIHGRYDPTPLSSAEHTGRLLGAPLLIFEDSGHVPYVEEFDRFVQELDGFLPKQDGPR